jgi:hypothetical protein
MPNNMDTIAIDQAGPFSIGDTITFTTVPDAAGYWVRNWAFQGDNRVLGEVHKADEHATFTLGPTAEWQSGPADGEAELGYRDKRGRYRRTALVQYDIG